MLIFSFQSSNNCYVCTSVYNSLHSMIVCITPLQLQLATCALVKSIDKLRTGQNKNVCVNPFPNKPWFLCACSTSLFKTLCEKEKLLVMSNFFFPTVFSTRLDNFLPFSSNLELSSANSFGLGGSKICRF